MDIDDPSHTHTLAHSEERAYDLVMVKASSTVLPSSAMNCQLSVLLPEVDMRL